MQASSNTTIQQYLQDTLRFFRNHLTFLVILALPFALLREAALQLVIIPAGEQKMLANGLAADLLLSPIYQSALIIYLASAIAGQQTTPIRCYINSVPFWPRMLLLTLASSMAIFAGLSVFILPGIFLMIRFSLADMVCILEQRSVIDSLRESFKESQPVTLVILIGLVLLFSTVTLISIGFGSLIAKTDNHILSFLATLVQAVLQSLYSIYLFRVFSGLRKQKQ